jgi:hypothetical protein
MNLSIALLPYFVIALLVVANPCAALAQQPSADPAKNEQID